MNDTHATTIAPEEGKKPLPKVKRHHWLRTVCIVMVCLVLLPILLLTGLTLYLTPTRLTELVNREGSQYFNADIHAEDVNFSLWSTFPRFKITTGEITIRSRTLDNISEDVRRQLPDNAPFLGSLKSFSGEINVVDLFMNRYVIHDVNVTGLRLNLVAYNDSINNYDIVPTSGESLKKVPYIRVNKIMLKEPGSISYYSASTDTRAILDLSSLNLERTHGHHDKADTYLLQLGGSVTAKSSGLNILHNFPFSLGGKVKLRFNPFGAQLSDFAIDLGKIHSLLTMSVGIGDDPRIETFDYKISNVSIAELLGYLPKEFMPSMQGLRADLQVSATAKLLSSWSFSSEAFPSIAVDFHIPEGRIAYTTTLQKGSAATVISLRHSPIDCNFIFNGERPGESYVKIPNVAISGEGITLDMNMLITRLTTTPHIAVGLNLKSDLQRTLRLIPGIDDVNVKGNIALVSDIDFDISEFSKEGVEKGLKNFSTDAVITSDNLSIASTSPQIGGKVNDLQINIREHTASITSATITDPTIEMATRLGGGVIAIDDKKIKFAGMSLSAGSRYAGTVTPAAVRAGVPIKINGDINSIAFSDPGQDIQVKGSGISFADVMYGEKVSNVGDMMKDGFRLTADKIDIGSERNSASIKNADILFSINQRHKMQDDNTLAADNGDDSEDALEEIPGVPHTPEYINIEAPDMLTAFLEKYSMLTLVKIGRIDLYTKGLGGDNYLSDIDIAINDDDIKINSIFADIENTRATIRGDVSDMRPFLTKKGSEKNPLNLKMDINLDTININALAHAYVMSRGGMQNIPRHDNVTASDSTTLLLPRNIALALKLKAQETLYTNLQFDNLDADIRLKGGLLDIPRLSLATSFGSAALNVRYAGREQDSLALNLGLDIKDIDIVKFFKKFHKLLEMMPEMKNLTGNISASARMEGRIFPDMYINVPSAAVDATIEGRDLRVHQSDFIRKITKMMLIRTDNDIDIKNMDVHVRAHDNLLQLDPFYFEFDRYRLRMLGINNFNGALYYHIDVEKSPVPFAFGINIEGMFHHPKLRFGGAHYDVKHAEEISSEIQEDNKMNMTKVLKQLLRAFIGKASEY